MSPENELETRLPVYRFIARISEIKAKSIVVDIGKSENFSDEPKINEEPEILSPEIPREESEFENETVRATDHDQSNHEPYPSSPAKMLIAEIRDVVAEIVNPSDKSRKESSCEESSVAVVSSISPGSLKNEFIDEEVGHQENIVDEGNMNKSFETDSSPKMKSSEGRTSSDVDSSLAFKNENCEKFSISDTLSPIENKFDENSPDVAGSSPLENQSNKNKSVDVKENEKSRKNRKNNKRKVNVAAKLKIKKRLGDSFENVASELRLEIKNFDDDDNDSTSTVYKLKISDTDSQQSDGYRNCEIDENESCKCDAEKNLKALQNEVCSTITKLRSIENFFENEIEKRSMDEADNVSPSDDVVIEYRYKEPDDVLVNSSCVKKENDLILPNGYNRDIFQPGKMFTLFLDTNSIFEAQKNLWHIFDSIFPFEFGNDEKVLSPINGNKFFNNSFSIISKNKRFAIRKRRSKGKRKRIEFNHRDKDLYFADTFKEIESFFRRSSYMKTDGINEDFEKFNLGNSGCILYDIDEDDDKENIEPVYNSNCDFTSQKSREMLSVIIELDESENE